MYEEAGVMMETLVDAERSAQSGENQLLHKPSAA
jgi:hypothetical protein